MTYEFEVAVIGAGQGGLPAAHMAANLGAKVLLVEAREVGGT
jgi:pyruvate/2-oxoglutarate dehydrogenase complex dihydrolipoamide dehydrogenase (E3) component